MAPSRRPPVASLAASPYFQEDVLLRALRFLDTLLQREAAQKVWGVGGEVWSGMAGEEVPACVVGKLCHVLTCMFTPMMPLVFL